MRKLNVLSLCDGMSCIQMALEKAEIPVENVFAAEIKEHAIRITKHNFPKTVHIGDVNKVSYKNGVLYTENESYETPIDLVVFGSPCFEAGTLVYTEQGFKPIEDVCVGDKVLTHKGRFKPVLNIGGKVADTVELLLEGIEPTRVTLNHPYFVARKDRENCLSKPEWKHVKNLRKGDYVAVPKQIMTQAMLTSNVITGNEHYWLPYLGKCNHKEGRKVFNLEVADDNSYTANRVVVHNCQSVSRAMHTGKRVGLEDKIRSGLFFECHRILREVNPEFFLMENVIMKPEDERVITELMGVNPVRINSALVTAQLRDRLYWTNIPTTIPTDKHIKLSDILIDGYSPWDKARCLMANDSHGYYNGCNWTPIKRFHRTVYKNFSTMIFPDKETYENCLKIANGILNGRAPRAEYFDEYVGDAFDSLRYLWKEERAKLQTVPLKYVEIMTEKEAADLCGDGWTVDVIAHILKGIKEPVKKHSIGLLR